MLADLVYKVAASLPCPVFWFCYEYGGPIEVPSEVSVDMGWRDIADTKGRARYLIQQGKMQKWRHRLARIPLTTEEIKEAIRVRYESDELAGIGMLGIRGSRSARGYLRLGLTRHTNREALAGMERPRILQTTLCGIACGTRFKYFE